MTTHSGLIAPLIAILTITSLGFEMIQPQPLVLQPNEVNGAEPTELRNAQTETRREPQHPQPPNHSPHLHVPIKPHIEGAPKQPYTEMSVEDGFSCLEKLSYLGKRPIRSFPCYELLESFP